jgi:hypothetical protein
MVNKEEGEDAFGMEIYGWWGDMVAAERGRLRAVRQCGREFDGE